MSGNASKSLFNIIAKTLQGSNSSGDKVETQTFIVKDLLGQGKRVFVIGDFPGQGN